jgi:hypothetical protein
MQHTFLRRYPSDEERESRYGTVFSVSGPVSRRFSTSQTREPLAKEVVERERFGLASQVVVAENMIGAA